MSLAARLGPGLVLIFEFRQAPRGRVSTGLPKAQNRVVVVRCQGLVFHVLGEQGRHEGRCAKLLVVLNQLLQVRRVSDFAKDARGGSGRVVTILEDGFQDHTVKLMH